MPPSTKKRTSTRQYETTKKILGYFLEKSKFFLILSLYNKDFKPSNRANSSVFGSIQLETIVCAFQRASQDQQNLHEGL